MPQDYAIAQDYSTGQDYAVTQARKSRYDNKVRLSSDILEKAEVIAQEWGLKNARAAVEAVFRKYSDSYLQGYLPGPLGTPLGGALGGDSLRPPDDDQPILTIAAANTRRAAPTPREPRVTCPALEELDDLLNV